MDLVDGERHKSLLSDVIQIVEISQNEILYKPLHLLPEDSLMFYGESITIEQCSIDWKTMNE